jgi:sphingosine kinase
MDQMSAKVTSSCHDNGKRRLLFLVNPASGSGRAVQLFKRKVMPLLTAAADQVEHQVLVTTARNSAFTFLKNLEVHELLRWNGIVIVSGDGLLFEVFNALLSRPDWKKAIQVPIGIIPAVSSDFEITKRPSFPNPFDLL